MRDPKRIKKLLKLIEKIWTENPDLRLCQLLCNCVPLKDPYYIEDFDLETLLKRTYKQR